jgi:DNA polymerase-1
MGKTLIMDMNNAIHRTYWTAKNIVGLDDVEKLNNFHIYFTLNAIKSYVNTYKPDKIIACWDEKPDYQRNDRKELFSEYKGNRSTDASPHKNNEKIKEFLYTLGIPSLFPRKLEADDVIAYLTESLEGSKVIISVDKDFLQLINKSVIVYDPIRKKETNTANFVENVGYEQFNFMTIKCLVGDKSDNVPGIPKFGKVKVKKYLEGTVRLTDEEYSIFTRNLELFRLDKYKDTDNRDELLYYQEQMPGALSMEPCYQEFLDLCQVYDINNILNKKEDWYNLFFVKHRLLSMFA